MNAFIFQDQDVPATVSIACRCINERLEQVSPLSILVNPETALVVKKENECYPGDISDRAWIICTQHETDCEHTVWKKGNWYYRQPRDGVDRKVPGGLLEVIEGWVCHYEG